jgi:hypothetical protein
MNREENQLNLSPCEFEEAEFVVFETDPFGKVEIGKVYEVHRNKVDEAYILNKDKQQDFGVWITCRHKIYKSNNTYTNVS